MSRAAWPFKVDVKRGRALVGLPSTLLRAPLATETGSEGVAWDASSVRPTVTRTA